MSPTTPECFHYKHLVDASKKQEKYYYYIIYYKGNCFFLVLNKGLNKATLKTSQLLKEKVFSCVSIFLTNNPIFGTVKSIRLIFVSKVKFNIFIKYFIVLIIILITCYKYAHRYLTA